jgi:AraC-like DNA-binding protein
MMPVMDGLELVKILKQNMEFADIPIMLLTAKGTKIDTVNGLQQGADDYLSKPFDSSELIARIESHLAQKKNIASAIYQSFHQQNSALVNQPQDNSGDKSSFAIKFSQLIDEQLENTGFGITQMASSLNIERSTLFRKVKKSFDCTPNQYLKNRRLHLSRQMLDQKSGSVSEIAYAVGFQSLSYFSRSFTKLFKVSPSQYPLL